MSSNFALNFRFSFSRDFPFTMGVCRASPPRNRGICLEFRVYAAKMVVRQSRLKAELQTGAVSGYDSSQSFNQIILACGILSGVSLFCAMPMAPDPDVELRIPANDTANPELSIVIPAMNKEITIGEFVDWCRGKPARANVRGEILIVDSSTDRTPEIALAKGARVLKTPKRGLGRAYIDAMSHIRGKFILMGDAV